MTTIGGRICVGNKGSCRCWVPIVCALLPGFPSAAGCSRQRRDGGGEGVVGRGGEPRVEILLIVLCFMAEMPSGQTGSNLAAC